MRVKMLETKTYYVDGIHENECLKGEKYDLPDHVAKSWIKQGFATKVKTQKPAEPKETKVIEPEETK